MDTIRAEYDAWVGAPPQDGLALGKPREDAAPIGIEQARHGQVAPPRQQAIRLFQCKPARRKGCEWIIRQQERGMAHSGIIYACGVWTALKGECRAKVAA